MSQLYLIPHIWFIILVWIALYIGDYYLTIYTAQKITTEMAQHLEFERSFELNPFYEEDVNRLRWISPRFLVLWLLISAFLVLAWVRSLLVGTPLL
ncbi:MAG: hypothetical protein ACK2TZ_03480, partial [Anaerolineales bacterium]